MAIEACLYTSRWVRLLLAGLLVVFLTLPGYRASRHQTTPPDLIPPSPQTTPLGVWEVVPLPETVAYHVADFFGDTGWAFGRYHIGRWDGQRWTSYPPPEGYGGDIIGVRVLGPDNAWAAGCQSIFHWDGSQWRLVPAPFDQRTDCLFALDFVSPTQGWAVGVEQDQANYSGLILEWDGKQWTRMTISDTIAFVYIDMISPTDGWMVENERYLFRWDGQEWRYYDQPELQGYVSSIAMVDSNDGWIVGHDEAGQGIIWRWDGTRWYEFQRARLGLESIVMVSSEFGWAVGGDWGQGGSLLLHWDGHMWSEYPISTDIPLSFVWANSTEDGWIFAGDEDIPPYDYGAVFRYRLASAATPTLSPTPSAISTATATPTPTLVTSPTPTSELITVSEQSSNNASKVSMWLLIAAAFGLFVIVAVLFLRRWRKV